MALLEWLYIPLSIIFVISFVGTVIFSTAWGNIFELYSGPPKPKKSRPKPKEKMAPTNINNETGYIPPKETISYDHNSIPYEPKQENDLMINENEEEKKEYEDNDYDNVPDVITKGHESNISNISNISPLSDHGETKKSFNYEIKEEKQYKNDINKEYYNVSNEETSTEALVYFLELQSRLQHLQSLVNTDINENTFHSVDSDQYYNGDGIKKDDDKPRDMVSEIHSNNMKLIESMIQNVIYDKSYNNLKEKEYDFYNRLNDDEEEIANTGNSNHYNSNWTQSQRKKNKRRASIEQKIYRNIDSSIGFMMDSFMKLMQNANIVGLITSAAILYSCGVLFYCIENNVNVSIFAYLLGIILIVIVMFIGYLFNISSVKRNTNEFIIAVVLSVILIYISIYWISYYYNTTASFILIMAIILSYQYKHGPIAAKQRNLDEIWVCLMLNCGLPLFAYYMQLPEIQSMDQLQSITQQQTEQEIINNVLAEETITYNDNDVNNNNNNNINNTEEAETWLMYFVDLIYRLITMILTDVWNMMDITYALDEEDIINQQQQQIQEEQQQQTQQIEQEQQELQQEQVYEYKAGPSTEEQSNIDGNIDDTLYWFNKIFYIFPYQLFNIILISWFITHSAMLIRNISIYKVVNTKLLYCMEILLSYILSILFWFNNVFDSTLFYWMILTIPWTMGLLKHIWEHKNITNDQQISYHTSIFNLWFFIAIYLSSVYNWIYQTGIIYSFFSTNLLIIIVPFYLIIQCMPQIINEFVWATDF